MKHNFSDNLNAFKEIFQVTKQELSLHKDLDSLLDQILYHARKFTNADAGSLFLLENNHLKFSYVQNDTLFKNDRALKNILYSNHEIPLDSRSIAGYCALYGETLVIDDVYALSPDVPYSFNKNFDRSSSYRTGSALTVPMKVTEDKVVGVIQILNSLDETGIIVPFTPRHRFMIELFAHEAAIIIERAKMTREIILRMIRMAELRDPKETGSHVQRVATYSIELYQEWASLKGIPVNEIKIYKDNLRLAAMLHDVGKVGISDSILKKPGKLTDEEFFIMKSHTLTGVKLFENSSSALDVMSAEISLNHHERWNGTGYPGKNAAMKSGTLQYGEGKKGKEIPLCGRIVALADVYDALSSMRCYKEAWSEEKVLEFIQKASEKDFDPELVEAFFKIHPVFNAIRNKYPEETGD